MDFDNAHDEAFSCHSSPAGWRGKNLAPQLRGFAPLGPEPLFGHEASTPNGQGRRQDDRGELFTIQKIALLTFLSESSKTSIFLEARRVWMLLRSFFVGQTISSPRPFLLARATAPVGRQMATSIVLLLALTEVATHFTYHGGGYRADSGELMMRDRPRVGPLTET